MTTLKEIINASLKERAKYGQLNIGQLIAILEKLPQKSESGYDNYVRFDFGYIAPTKCISWRGIYAEMAISFKEITSSSDHIKVADFLEMLKKSVGHIFTGYKGGNFRMKPNTMIWAANYSHANYTAITGATFCEISCTVILHTKWIST